MTELTNRHSCPYCGQRAVESVATFPYVRGKGLGVEFNSKTISGCRACVRKQLLLETLRSSVDGWASPSALLANPVLLAYGIGRACIVRSDEARVNRMMTAMGLSDEIDASKPVRIAYYLAAALIAADGRIYEKEVETASAIGKQLFPDFDEGEFCNIVMASKDIPPVVELATLMNRTVAPPTKEAVYRFLLAIAATDGEVAPQEQELLRLVADKLGLTGSGHGVDESV